MAAFLAKAGEGKTIADHQKGQVVFAQSDVADTIFYVQKGKVKLTVVSNNGKEAVVALLGIGDFVGEGCLAGLVLSVAEPLARTPGSSRRAGGASLVLRHVSGEKAVWLS